MLLLLVGALSFSDASLVKAPRSGVASRLGRVAGRVAMRKPAPKLKVKAVEAIEAPAKDETAVAPAKKEEWKGLESIYGGLYDGQVFTEYGWDPWGIGKKATKDQLLMYRESELTHGRVAMLAALGILTAERWHPFFNSPDGTALQQAAYITEKYPAFWFASGLVMSAIELLRAQKVFKNGGKKNSFIFRPYSADAMTLKDGVEPGDLGKSWFWCEMIYMHLMLNM
ncbi:hypothetical protein AAMO2058_001421900 [Amorphochlora amoebiformis]